MIAAYPADRQRHHLKPECADRPDILCGQDEVRSVDRLTRQAEVFRERFAPRARQRIAFSEAPADRGGDLCRFGIAQRRKPGYGRQIVGLAPE